MGANASKQQIGEKVKSIKKKLAENDVTEEAQYERLSKQSPETLTNMVESIEKALELYSPFPQSTLLLAFRADPERVKKALTECTGKVLTAPIQKEKYQWFKQYVFASTVWFKKTKDGKFLYTELMEISNSKQKAITDNMDAVYDHLKSHSKWDEIMNIESDTIIERQDIDAVGLLHESGIRDVLDLELKDSDDDGEDIEALKNFIDSNLAVNILMTTAKAINKEFQKEMGTILNRHGEFKPGPMKKVERAVSKLENDYMDEHYPKAAKLLDIVRCSCAYNTISQLLDGYKAFMSHIESGSSSLRLARVKNGFLDEEDGGYRDIKVNVVYHSTLNPDLKMVCEVQFILNQYLYEKKKVHKLYSIAREQTYFDMVVTDEETISRQKQLKAMNFEPILNVRDDVLHLNYDGIEFYKCTIDSDLGLLGMTSDQYWAHSDPMFFAINMETQKVIFRNTSSGFYNHHWITINDQKYLSLQTKPNTISMFRVSDDHQFEEDESMKITLGDDDIINFYEYDNSFEHLFIVRNKSILEKRSVSDFNATSLSIELEDKLGTSGAKLLSMTNDGKYCAIGSGDKTYFYIIALETQEQFKLSTNGGRDGKVPCFINGDSDLLAVGGTWGDGVEIWSVAEKKMVHHIDDCKVDDSEVWSMYSTNGILAVGLEKQYLQLYDVSTWTKIHRYDLNMSPYSLFLTADNKYLAAGGYAKGGKGQSEKCLVLQINQSAYHYYQ